MAIIEREDDEYVAFCPELDIASQGKTVEEARRNLIESCSLSLPTRPRSRADCTTRCS